MREWVLANLFLATLVMLAAGATFVVLWVLKRARVLEELQLVGVTLAMAAVLLVVYYAAKWLHSLIARWLVKRAH
jgi:hypothetical protein